MIRSVALASFVFAASACDVPRVGVTAKTQTIALANRRYGDLMAEVGRRFERAGRAAEAGRWALAEYDVDEMVEVFRDDLPKATPPESVQSDLAPLLHDFVATNPVALAKAAAARDRTAFHTAFARAADGCNACHVATGHAFIEVARGPGASVPRLDRVTPDGGTGNL